MDRVADGEITRWVCSHLLSWRGMEEKVEDGERESDTLHCRRHRRSPESGERDTKLKIEQKIWRTNNDSNRSRSKEIQCDRGF